MRSYSWKPWGLLLLVVWLRSNESSAQAGAADIYAVATVGQSTIVIVDAQGRLLRSTDGRSFAVRPLADVPMYAVSFANATFGIAVGDSGALFVSGDGGDAWTRQESGTANPLLGVSLVNESIATVVGVNGTILRTVDGGATWTPQDAGATDNLFGVSFSDANHGLAVGDAGRILRTTDGGNSWATIASGTTNHLQTVAFAGVDTAIAVGDLGTILRSSDGGLSWETQSGPASSNLYGLSVVDGSRAFAVGCQAAPDLSCQSRATILRTTDGGLNWVDISGLHRRPLYAVSFYSANIGTAVGGNEVILRTTDGGDHWTSLAWSREFGAWFDPVPPSPPPPPPPPGLYAISMSGPQAGIAVGADGAVMRTDDGGASWAEQSSATTATLASVSLVDPNTATAVGVGGTIVRTVDGGATWTAQSSGTFRGLAAVSFPSRDIGWAVGEVGTILHTEDGGETWTAQSSGTTNNLSVSFVDANTGWVVGHQPTSPFNDVILRTSDGGANWTVVVEAYGLGLNAVSFVDASTGWVVGWTLILHTDDGGAHWTVQLSGDGGTAVTFIDANRGWVVGGLAPLYTRDGGASWSRSDVDGAALRGVSFLDADNGSAVGTNSFGGTILRTTDGGANWETTLTGHDPPPPPPTFTAARVSFGDPDTGFAVLGDLGSALMRTRDGGASWTASEPGHPDYPNITPMYAVSFLDADTGWVGGVATAPRDMGARPAALTTDGGETWSGPLMQRSLGQINEYRVMAMSVGADRVWAVGEVCDVATIQCQPLVASTDGASWSLRDESTTCSGRGCAGYFFVSFVDANTGWLANRSGIEHTSDGGNRWTRVSTLVGSGLAFADANYGWMVGRRGSVLRTTDGGTFWLPQSTPTTNDLYAITALDASTATAIGQFGTILRTIDGGANWTLQNSGTLQPLLGISFVDPDTAWVVGTYVIRHTVTGGQ